MHADVNDKIEVPDVSDSRKLYNIPDGKKVIVEFISMAQPVGRNRGKWRQMTRKWEGAGRSLSKTRGRYWSRRKSSFMTH